MNGKNKEKGLFRVAVYFNEADLTTLVKEAERLRFRRVGIPVKILKPHGFADEWLANTDGIAKTLKYYAAYYKEHEAERTAELAKVQAEEKALAERKAKLGIA